MDRLFSRLFFDKKDRAIVDMVDKVRSDDVYRRSISALTDPNLHPDGICRLAVAREVRYAYAVINVLSRLDSGATSDRLRALTFLHSELVNNSEIANGYNTGRVLVQIMKELARAHGNDIRRLKLAHDFHRAASGKIRIVRKLLARYNLLEMPEEYNQASFDNHVHDANTKGRKSPTHLILDAWIKGVRSLTVVYYNHVNEDAAAELLNAAEIMGIEVQVGIEYKTVADNGNADLIWTPSDILNFLKRNNVQAMMALGREVSDYEKKLVLKLFNKFITIKLPEISRGIGAEIPVPTEAEFVRFVGEGQASRLHIAEFMSGIIAPVVAKQSSSFVKDNDGFTPAVIMAHWLAGYESVKGELADVPVPELLKETPAALCERIANLTDNRMITLTLTEMTFYDVLNILWNCKGGITHIEIFNLKDWYDGRLGHIGEVTALKEAINDPTPIELKRLVLDRYRGEPEDSPKRSLYKTILNNLETLRAFYRGRKLEARIGSDSTSRVLNDHGMGFAYTQTLTEKAQGVLSSKRGKAWEKLPIYANVLKVSKSGAHEGRLGYLLSKISGGESLKYKNTQSWEVLADTGKIVDKGGDITTLGGTVSGRRGLSFESTDSVMNDKLSPLYLNTAVVCWLKVLLSFIPAVMTFYYSQTLWIFQYFGIVMWFAIAGIRNIIQSTLGRGGVRNVMLLRWGGGLNWARISDSLMFTGLSVILLEFIVRRLFLEHIMHVNPARDSVFIFTVIAIAYGFYIAAHNYFRGLSSFTIFGNIVRSLVAVPVSVFYAFIIAETIRLMGVHDNYAYIFPAAAIISKFASDTVAGVVEGYADMRDNIIMRSRDYRVKLAQMYKCYAKLEVVLPEQNAYKILMDPDKLAAALSGVTAEIRRELAIHSLDMLYFWYYLPRASNMLRQLIKSMSAEESHLLFYMQQILQRETLVTGLIKGGLLGAKYENALGFYLEFHKRYLMKIRRLTMRKTERIAPEEEGA